jgi:cytidylate kinase
VSRRRKNTGSQAIMIIAIDGPAASGKGTLGKRLAEHFGLRHLDT